MVPTGQSLHVLACPSKPFSLNPNKIFLLSFLLLPCLPATVHIHSQFLECRRYFHMSIPWFMSPPLPKWHFFLLPSEKFLLMLQSLVQMLLPLQKLPGYSKAELLPLCTMLIHSFFLCVSVIVLYYSKSICYDYIY